MTDKKYYKTPDRHLIAWLRYRMHQYADTEVENEKRVWFIFEETEALKKDVDDYFNKKSFEMIPYVFIKEIQSVTDVIYQIIRNHNGRERY
jgi:hypothetical protein